MSLPTALRRAYLTNAAAAATLRSIQEMCFRSAIPLEREPGPRVPHLLEALERAMTEERHLIGLLHRGLADQAYALHSWDAGALTDVATAVEQYTLALREAGRERIALTRLLAGEWSSRGPLPVPAGRLRAAVGRVVALDLAVRAGAGRALADLLSGQSALVTSLDAWETDRLLTAPAPRDGSAGGDDQLEAARGHG